jgi:hypothetical protein
MIATQPIAEPALTPAMTFVGEWRAAGALQGLPRWMRIANDDGTPSGPFLLCARKAFTLATIGLTIRDPIINIGVDGVEDFTPTQVMLDAWMMWTS